MRALSSADSFWNIIQTGVATHRCSTLALLPIGRPAACTASFLDWVPGCLHPDDVAALPPSSTDCAAPGKLAGAGRESGNEIGGYPLSVR